MTTAEQPKAHVIQLDDTKKQRAQAQERHPATAAKKAAPAKAAAAKAPAKKAPAASGPPAPQRRPEQKPGEGEIKVRLGAPVVALLREPANRKASTVGMKRKLDAAHVYKDGSVVIVLNESEAKAVTAALAGQTSRSATAVVAAIQAGGIK